MARQRRGRVVAAISCGALLATWLAVPAVTVAGATARQARKAATALHVGYIAPLTGPFASIGTATQQGWDTGLKVFGSTVDGVHIDATFVDDAATATQGLTDAKRLVAAHVNLIEGPILANVDEAVANYLGPQKVPLVDLCACSATQVKIYKQYGNAFASSSTADQTATYAARYMRKTLGYSHITVYAMNYAFGWEVIGSFVSEFKALGGTIDKVVWVPITATDQSAYVAQIPQTTQAVAALVLGALAPNFLRTYGSLTHKGPAVFGITGLTTDQATLPAEPAATVTGVESASWYCDGSTSSANKTFVKAFERRYHAVPGYYAESGYDKVHELVAALKSLHGKVPGAKALRKAVVQAEATIVEPRGRQKINSKTDSPTQTISICKVESVHGTLRNVSIKTYKNAPPWGLLRYATWWRLIQHDSTSVPSNL